MALALGVLLVGCGTPGYRIEIRARWTDPDFSPAFDRLEALAKSSGLETAWERQRPQHTGLILSSYSVPVPGEYPDRISLSLAGDLADGSVRVGIYCRDRGTDPIFRARMDALGDLFARALEEIVGPSYVLEDRWAFGPYTIHTLRMRPRGAPRRLKRVRSRPK